MGVREAFDRHRTATIIASVTVVVIAVFIAVRGNDGVGSGSKPKAFYTVDDGATWFADDVGKLPPFDYNGKQAVMCFVYKTGDGPPWVSYLQRYTPEGLKKAQEQTNEKPNPMGFAATQRPPIVVKKPKTADTGWVPLGDPRAVAIMTLTSPDGKTDGIVPVDPNE